MAFSKGEKDGFSFIFNRCSDWMCLRSPWRKGWQEMSFIKPIDEFMSDRMMLDLIPGQEVLITRNLGKYRSDIFSGKYVSFTGKRVKVDVQGKVKFISPKNISIPSKSIQLKPITQRPTIPTVDGHLTAQELLENLDGEMTLGELEKALATAQALVDVLQLEVNA